MWPRKMGGNERVHHARPSRVSITRVHHSSNLPLRAVESQAQTGLFASKPPILAAESPKNRPKCLPTSAGR